MEEDVEHLETTRSFSVEEKLTSDRFDESFVKFMSGNELNIDFVRRNGFFTPFVFKEKCGLGLRVPSKGFTVHDVKQLIGEKRIVDVMDVSSQQALEMYLDDWVDYYTAPERQYLLNVISLEFSHTPMEHMVHSPRVVRDLDWVDIYWPAHLKKAQKEGTNDMASMKYPKVQKYCLWGLGWG
jgi:F-box/leucine-rich repeat protein 10/11